VNVIKGIGQFWYDFIVGDDWKIAVAVVSVLAVGALVTAAEIGVEGQVLVPVIAAGIFVAFTISLLIDVKQHTR
jgi:hypothetical protein